MTAPNMTTHSSMVGKTAAVSLADTNPTVFLDNAAASGLLKRVRSIIVANDDGANDAQITIALHPLAAGAGTGVELANSATVPAGASLLLQGDPLINLEEDRSLVATASAGDDLNVIATYDEVS